ncbi:activator-dependent family glycosyltransferase [Saccharothrix sp. S26]|uniref:activator-dependent family glycosyltransferase n=1 Tax=Saccharothrix sp. S26 TaxID=2907215 RepID=UPI001F29F735|nr:activator-dependent family glycosyltransferase [Saccharothrix sp. S26]MCE6995349.1 activator-dependent family glycosyltransferase [Saccharothrix sp. S26]
MRVLMTSVPVAAHFNTMVPLAWAIEAAGHDVHVAVKPQLVDHVTGAGLVAVPVGSGDGHAELLGRLGADLVDFYASVDFTGMRGDPPQQVLSANDVLTGTFYAPANDTRFIRDVADYADHWQPNLIIWEQFTFAGAVVGAAKGIPHGRLVWSPDLFHRMRQDVEAALTGQPPWRRDDALGDWLAAEIGAFGGVFDEDLLFGQWQIELSPPEIRLPSPREVIPGRYVPYNGPSVVPDWLREPPDLPRVALTMGITARGGDYANPVDVRAVIAELSELDVEVVATVGTGERDGIGPVPDRVRLVDFVPMRALLPTCDAVIHHGGAGTWASALVSGVPQIVVSTLWDNVFRGKQLADLGAGLYLTPAEAGPAAVRDGLVTVLSDESFRAAARRLEHSVRAQPTPADVVLRLEEMAK